MPQIPDTTEEVLTKKPLTKEDTAALPQSTELNNAGDTSLQELTDWLCEECKSLGYCKRTLPVAPPISEEELMKGRMLTAIANMGNINDYVPLSLRSLKHSGTTRFTLQRALDAFHQQDYNTAKEIAGQVLARGYKGPTAYITLAVSNYYLMQYEECYYNLNEVMKYDYHSPISAQQAEALMDLCVIMTEAGICPEKTDSVATGK